MRTLRLRSDSGRELRVLLPLTRAQRRRGLLGRDGLSPHEAMLFWRCRVVHTFGMRFSIEVLFLDKDLGVIQARTVAPGRLAWNIRARHVLECAPSDGAAPVYFRAVPRDESPHRLEA